MLALPFDLGSMRTRGSPIPVRDSVARGVNDTPLLTISLNGTMYLRAGANVAPSEIFELVWVDRSGNEIAVDPGFRFRLTVQGENRGWALSPDGTRLAIGLFTEAGDDIWVKQLPAGPVSRVTFDTLAEHRPRWSMDGRTITYLRYAGRGELYRRSSDGTGVAELVVTAPDGVYEAAFAPDGKTLLLRTGGQTNVPGGRDISVMRPGEDTVQRPLVASPQYDESTITLSPDGRLLAYESDETGRSEVYLRPFPNADAGKWQVSTDGGRAPLWAKNGRELFYVNAAREMIVVPVTFGASAPQFGQRTQLFRMREELYLAEIERYTPFDISLDGRRFIMARRVAVSEGQEAPLVVTENWFEELRRIVGR
jgi:serine/threonine-protein kinase